MSNKTLNLKRIIELQTELLEIIEDLRTGRISPEVAEIMSKPLNKELGGF